MIWHLCCRNICTMFQPYMIPHNGVTVNSLQLILDYNGKIVREMDPWFVLPRWFVGFNYSWVHVVLRRPVSGIWGAIGGFALEEEMCVVWWSSCMHPIRSMPASYMLHPVQRTLQNERVLKMWSIGTTRGWIRRPGGSWHRLKLAKKVCTMVNILS